MQPNGYFANFRKKTRVDNDWLLDVKTRVGRSEREKRSDCGNKRRRVRVPYCARIARAQCCSFMIDIFFCKIVLFLFKKKVFSHLREFNCRFCVLCFGFLFFDFSGNLKAKIRFQVMVNAIHRPVRSF